MKTKIAIAGILLLNLLLFVGCSRNWNSPYDPVVLAENIQAFKPSILTVGNVSTTMRITWDNKFYASGYLMNVYRDGTKIGNSTTSYYQDYPIVIGTTYSYQITLYGEGVESVKSDVSSYKAN
ncbi:MAG: hypothetical protein A2452_07410 [Candidatus Firestonebacteria bacterium RIFOXYC2_FULL_39_67]|nr:MAG: hypothetical protein A2452_07410 [Candidatus Firestonebacteria bacterium RIFOXYC2_FULL_39_67]